MVVVEQFVNTLDERTFSRHGENHVATDELTSVEALAVWLEAHDLPALELGEPGLTTALALRAGLREALTGDISTALNDFPVRMAPDASGGLRLVANSGVAGLDVMIEAVAVAVASGGWSRLKLCASSDCRWAFYDTSRSGGGRWCSMEVCGNRHKTRTYRRRRAE
nr:CGNR zinc finger domain-containing protein [Kineosporia mesophila]